MASHHPIVDPILPELRAALAGSGAAGPRGIPMLSTVDGVGETPDIRCRTLGGQPAQPGALQPRRSPPRGATRTTFVEISPHPLLTHAITDTLGEHHHHALGTLLRDTHDTLTFHTNLNAAHTTHPPDTEHPPEPHPRCPPPPGTTPTTGSPPARGTPAGTHPLLGIGVTDPTNGARVWESTLGPDLLWLGDHRVDDACVLPGAAYAEIALAAVTDAFGADDDASMDDP